MSSQPPELPACEIDAFVADDSAQAFETVVDRLLASPAFGERWGRHWLDVARYADSNGLDENLAYANAFRYRDYVIAAFNKDKPFDEFVRDTVNFLDYIGEPMQLERRSIGLRVLAFLLVFFLFAYFLKKEYWKDVK